MRPPFPSLGRLRDKVAIVTGGGATLSSDAEPGIGAAIALTFAAEAANVCVVDLDISRAMQVQQAIEAHGGTAIVATADVSRADECSDIVASVLARFGHIDILVNNVGIGSEPGGLPSLSERQWRSTLDTNLTSAFLMTRAALRSLIEQRGAIVNIASVAGIRAHGAAAYGASKAALLALTREIAVAHGRDGVRANAIAPGHLFTPMVKSNLDATGRQRRRNVAPLNIEGTAWDVASATLFLAGPEARFITGTCIAVDGGVSELACLAALERVSP